tara:strand:- start:777 stop:1412 length:636 start_codon:yes stop_codon:yes gene_type:complete
MKEKPNYYAILTAEVRYNKDLTPNAKLLFAEITALCNMNGQCFASNRYFADLYGKSKTSISKWISQLVAFGYVSVAFTYKEGSKEIDNRYISILNGGIEEKLNTPIEEKLKDNTTSINTNITYNNKREFFKKPNVLEIKDYCLERNNNIDAESFFDFYESKNWFVGKNKMKDWKASIRTWERRNKDQSNKSKINTQISEWQKAKQLIGKIQ